jgi:DNA-binding CsgD family transcriptional regulator
LYLRTFALKLSANIAAAALDAFDFPVIVVDEHRQVLMANTAAETLLAAGIGLCAKNGRLHAVPPNDNAALAGAVRAAVHPEPGTPRSAVVLTLQAGGKHRYRGTILPVCPDTPLALPWRRPLALIVLGDPESVPDLETHEIRALFGLTPAEARIALGLARGRVLEEIATQAGITMNTARSQMKSALRKAGASRQADLVRMVSNLPRVRR